jgi:hypothetical protein
MPTGNILPQHHTGFGIQAYRIFHHIRRYLFSQLVSVDIFDGDIFRMAMSSGSTHQFLRDVDIAVVVACFDNDIAVFIFFRACSSPCPNRHRSSGSDTLKIRSWFPLVPSLNVTL